MDKAEIEAMIETVIAKTKEIRTPWDIDRVVETIKTLGFPLVMCGLMSWAFYDIGKMVFAEFVESGRKVTAAVETSFRENREMCVRMDANMARIEKHLERHAEALERISKKQ